MALLPRLLLVQPEQGLQELAQRVRQELLGPQVLADSWEALQPGPVLARG